VLQGAGGELQEGLAGGVAILGDPVDAAGGIDRNDDDSAGVGDDVAFDDETGTDLDLVLADLDDAAFVDGSGGDGTEGFVRH
jgi:hypothetical protein